MADISRNTTPAWQDPHLKDRGDYTEQDIQNIQEKGGILPDCIASMFVGRVRQCFSAVWADGFPRCRHRFPVM